MSRSLVQVFLLHDRACVGDSCWDASGDFKRSLGHDAEWTRGHVWVVNVGMWWRQSLGRDAGKGERAGWPVVGCRYSLRCDRVCVGDSRWDASGDVIAEAQC